MLVAARARARDRARRAETVGGLGSRAGVPLDQSAGGRRQGE